MTDHLRSTFLDIVKRPTVTLQKWCDNCGRFTDWYLIRETERTEKYQCPGCGAQQEYTVR